jgi:hypothetical protein
VGWLQPDVPKCLPHDLSYRWQWVGEHRREGRPLPSRRSPHLGCLDKRRKTPVKMVNFPLLPFLDGEMKLLGSQKDPPLACLEKHWKDHNPESLQ